MIVLVTGGSGCGKSVWAEKLIQRWPRENRIYLATMQLEDRESAQRAARHRAQRAGLGFQTLEWGKDLAHAPIPEKSILLLEDLVNWTANEMFDGGDPDRVVPALKQLAFRCRHLVMVTGNLFSDGMPYSPSVREYLRRLAEINRQAAELADCAVEVVYSVPVVLKGELQCL